jgi:hypothetical protein
MLPSWLTPIETGAKISWTKIFTRIMSSNHQHDGFVILLKTHEKTDL